jgi:hypothetical protein
MRWRAAALAPVACAALVAGGCGGGSTASTTESGAATTKPSNPFGVQKAEVDLHPGESHTFAPSDFDAGGVPVVCISKGTRLTVAVYRSTGGRTIDGQGPVLRITRHGRIKVSCAQSGKHVAR